MNIYKLVSFYRNQFHILKDYLNVDGTLSFREYFFLSFVTGFVELAVYHFRRYPRRLPILNRSTIVTNTPSICHSWNANTIKINIKYKLHVEHFPVTQFWATSSVINNCKSTYTVSKSIVIYCTYLILTIDMHTTAI